MMLGRRQFLQHGGAGIAALTATTGIATAADVTVRGQVVDYTGSPITNRKIAVKEQRRDGIFRYVETDADGVFSTDVNPKETYTLCLYKSDGGQLHAPELNGVPHIEGLGDHYVGSDETDVGTLDVPRGYEVDVVVLDTDGNPIEGADIDFRDGSGFGAHAQFLTTNRDGYLVIENADFTGFEAAGVTSVSVSLSSDANGGSTEEYTDRFQITEPVTIRVKEGGGMSLQSGATGDADPIETTTARPTATPTVTPDSQATTATSAGQTGGTTVSRTSSDSQRGFLRNGENADDLGFLTDPLVLTVGGFALSVAGIVHQLVKG